MKNLIYIGLLTISMAACSLSAQENHESDRRANCHTQWMKKELHLNPSQTEKISAINVDVERKLEDYKYKSSDVADITKKAKQLDEERAQRMEYILSPEQLFRYERISPRTKELAGTCILSNNSQ